jgi:hypothetical protein
MNLHKVFAAIGLVCSLIFFASAVFAQEPGTSSGGTVPSAPAKEAPAAPGSQSAANAESEAKALTAQIEKARQAGKDVGKAAAEEQKGEAALQAGYKAEAAEHFKRAREDLSTM